MNCKIKNEKVYFQFKHLVNSINLSDVSPEIWQKEIYVHQEKTKCVFVCFFVHLSFMTWQ